MFNFEERPSDSPFIEKIWRNHPTGAGPFISMAVHHWSMVITRMNGKTTLTVRGPETKASIAYCPPEAEHYCVLFKLGTFMPSLPIGNQQNTSANLPEASSTSFWLNGSAWQYPEYENIDVLVERLARQGLIQREPVVGAALRGKVSELSLRSVQRRFLQVTGLTHGMIDQIDRARYATLLLKQGTPILDTVELAGYADQPHLNRSLKRYAGQTPAQLLQKVSPLEMSFLFKTQSPP